MKEKATFKSRSYRNYDKVQFQTKLCNNNWDEFYDHIDVDEAWDDMLHIIEESIESFCPTKEIKIKKLKEKLVTQELLEFINDKYDPLRLAKRTNNNEDWNTARIARNPVAGMVRKMPKKIFSRKKSTKTMKTLTNFGRLFLNCFQIPNQTLQLWLKIIPMMVKKY